MKIQLEFMELILLQRINRNPGKIDWDSHPNIDKLMRVGLVYFLTGWEDQTYKVRVYISDIGKEVLFRSLPTSGEPNAVVLWN